MTSIELTIKMIEIGATVIEKINKDGSIVTSYYPNPPSLFNDRDLMYLIEPETIK